MDLIPAWVKGLLDVWCLRLLVLLSLTLQIILSLFGNRRKYMTLLWMNILVWTSYLMADLVATIALSMLSDAQADHNNSNTLWAIWAPLLLLHLGGPDTITAYSLEDNKLWMRHLYTLVVQFSVACYVFLMSWKHSWFSTMSIPALVAGLVKCGERIWVLVLVSHYDSEDIMPLVDLGGVSSRGNNNTLEDNYYERVLRIAHGCLKEFKNFIQNYDLRYNYFSTFNLPTDDGINLYWNVIEVEMGLMFDLLYTKAALKLRKKGWILRCITFACTVTVSIGLMFRLIFTREDGEKWQKVDIVITEVLLVGALALEIVGAKIRESSRN